MVRFNFSIAALAAILVPQVAAQCPGVNGRFQPKMASGYRQTALATGLRAPRGIVVDSEDNLLVVEQSGGSVRRFVLSDSGENVCASSNAVLVSGGASNHGIALSKDGKTLFLSNLNQVTAYDYDAVAGTVGQPKVLITGMRNNGPHPTRAILVSKFDPDKIMVAIGSAANVDTQTVAQSSARCMIKVFSISQLMSSPVSYNAGGEVLGWGLRNIVGMGEDPMYGGIWSVENSMDNVRLGGRDVHNENPAEKLNYHGALNDTNNALFGANYGYPSCVSAWDTQLLGVNSLKVGDLFQPDSVPAANDCASRQHPAAVFPSHTAPLDVKFTNDSSTAYISFHGSWNRQPPDGYRVMKVDFKDGKPVAPLDSKNAGVTIMENTNTRSCPNGCFRPVGLDFDSKGRMFMSSDQSGELYVIYGAQ